MHCQISFSFTTQRKMKFEGDYSCITTKRKAREFIMLALYFQMPSTIEKSKLRVQKTEEEPSWFS